MNALRKLPFKIATKRCTTWYIRTNLVVTFLVKSRNCRYQEGNSEGVGYSRGRKIKVKEGIKIVTERGY